LHGTQNCFMDYLKNLTHEERELLLQFPAYVSLLAANGDNKMNEVEKKAAVKFTHIKTYAGEEMLHDFYKEIDKHFEKNIELLDRQLPKGKEERSKAIKDKLRLIEEILLKLDNKYTEAMHKSMTSYKKHVSIAHRNILEYFIFPMPIDGITN